MSSSPSSSSSGGGDWCTIESDPGVFTSLIESFGVRNAELSELWSLDDDTLSSLPHVYGLIFLFKWVRDAESADDRPTLSGDDMPTDLFFARQTVTNACATQAILSVLFNAASSSASSSTNAGDGGDGDNEDDTNKLDLGPILSTFRSFTSSFPPDLKGESIGSSEEIRAAHNGFARNDPFVSDKKRVATEDDDVFHFVAYVPHRGGKDGGAVDVYELDGLKAGPVLVGSCGEEKKGGDDKSHSATTSTTNGTTSSTATSSSGDDVSEWLRVARGAIQSRIERYAASEIKFNLMAVVEDRRVEIRRRIDILNAAGLGEDSDDVAALRARLASEDEKRIMWRRENERRRHNYLPFCVELLRSLARSGKLPELTKEANDRVRAAREAAAAAKKQNAGK